MSRMDEYVKRAVDAAPPLTPEQRDRIRMLLMPVVAPSSPAERRVGALDEMLEDE